MMQNVEYREKMAKRRRISRLPGQLCRTLDYRVGCHYFHDIHNLPNPSTRGMCQSLTTTEHLAKLDVSLSTTQNVSAVLATALTRVH